ncbi:MULTISPECIES: response regulator [Agrobacterium]|uniref:PAS domain-containing hybrid sensor histidine kinase/response regulator n=1 Tax=Agrobacterium TaxID=357 RepID=UPI00230027A7|nr:MULTISPECIES: response regulator [Agrobacterium]MDA5628195.1 response regulator [Agrobacterium sp. ST15.16.055]MDA6978059.1 response regulator [Agrobacterium salinitolerans]
MTEGCGLLEKACKAVAALDLPACIKDSELRYVVVNAAYARVMGQEPSGFEGHTTLSLSADIRDAEREDRERRSLVFATDETIACHVPTSVESSLLRCERFVGEDGNLFLFEMFEETPSAVSRKSAAVGGASDILFSSGVMDFIDAGIVVYDRDNRLVYCNARFAEFYGDLDIELKPGIRLEALMKTLYFSSGYRFLEGDAPSFEDWMQKQLRDFSLSYLERVEQFADGRWVRMINKRLDNGMLVGLRVDVTEFKAHETLLSTQIRETWLLRAALEQLPVGVFLRDQDRRLTYANAAYDTFLGGNLADYMGKTESEMFPQNGSQFQQENERILQTGEALERTGNMPQRNGQAIPVITRLGRVATPDDEYYLVGSVTDVSLLQEREKALIAAQAEAEKLHRQLEAVLHALPVGVLLLDADLVIEYVNPFFYEVWGEIGGEKSLVGKTYREFMEMNFDSGLYDYGDRPFDEVYGERVQRLLKEEVFAPREVRSKSGKVTVISKTRLEGGKILSTYADVTDVRMRDVEISKAKAELERVGEYMQGATRAMAQGLVLVEQGTIIMSNEAMARMFDVPPHLLEKGCNWSGFFAHCAGRGDFGTAEEAAETLRAWRENIAANRPFSWLIHVAGKSWLNLEATNSSGNYWLIIVTDVTEMKLREEELQRLLSRAEAADRAKSEFLANMSHEIRTPMNGVLGMAELLAKSNLDTRQKTFTDIIVKSGNALLTIINDILDFSKIEAGQMRLRSVPFDPAEAVEDVVSLLSSAALEKDIELIVRIDASVFGKVIGDAGRFRQIVTNIVGNAVKFTETGHVLVELSARSAETSEAILSLRVEDSGIGIPADKLETIFDKFSQVDGSATRRHEGTGLGLAITVGLVGLFDGAINVVSDVGKGSTFEVNIPFQVTERQRDLPFLSVAIDDIRVLVIDDNDVNRRILTEQLRSWGIDGHAVGDGPTGIAVLEEAVALGFAIDAVILDYHMPVMNGLDVVERIRADARFDDIAIVFLTSMDVVGDETLFTDLNVQAHLMKPARARLLRSTLFDVVRDVRLKRARQAPALLEAGHDARAVRPENGPVVRKQRADTATAVPLRHRSNLVDVLVAEDNDVNQIVFSQILQQAGLRFLIVGNGKKAVQAWQENNPALILMDVSMPVMNGHQATQAIRAAERTAADGRHVPIIGVTAHTQEADRELCLEAGMDDYLSKPISPETLEDKIAQWLGENMPRRDAPRV